MCLKIFYFSLNLNNLKGILFMKVYQAIFCISINSDPKFDTFLNNFYSPNEILKDFEKINLCIFATLLDK